MGATEGFGTGGLVAVGNGGGGSSSIERVGEGKGFLVFEFTFVLSFALMSTTSAGLAPGSGVADVLAFRFVLLV